MPLPMKAMASTTRGMERLKTHHFQYCAVATPRAAVRKTPQVFHGIRALVTVPAPSRALKRVFGWMPFS